MSFPSIGLSQDFSVTWNAQMSAHVLLDKRGGLKRVLACRDSGGADDWVWGRRKGPLGQDSFGTYTFTL